MARSAPGTPGSAADGHRLPEDVWHRNVLRFGDGPIFESLFPGRQVSGHFAPIEGASDEGIVKRDARLFPARGKENRDAGA